MFILAIVIAIIIGYLIRGNIRNLETVEFHGIWFVFSGFFIEFLIIMLIRNHIVTKGFITFSLEALMYLLLLLFTFINRRDPFLLMMGFGFLLNAVPIFFNGGTMPVSETAIKAIGLSIDVEKQGLWTLINDNTKFAFLCDIMPMKFLTRFVMSIGDIIAALGLMLFIITGMQKQTNKLCLKKYIDIKKTVE